MFLGDYPAISTFWIGEAAPLHKEAVPLCREEAPLCPEEVPLHLCGRLHASRWRLFRVLSSETHFGSFLDRFSGPLTYPLAIELSKLSKIKI